mmetsp:Transcript_10335/g.23177  ORF Transcript_10335/g.23177 Transcript_10335/m.23177 type:complete len:546 (-) Transcript_10335:2253-3890(-)
MPSISPRSRQRPATSSRDREENEDSLLVGLHVDTDNDKERKGHHRSSEIPEWRRRLGRLIIGVRSANSKTIKALAIGWVLKAVFGILLFLWLGKETRGKGPKHHFTSFPSKRIQAQNIHLSIPKHARQPVPLGGIPSRRLTELGYTDKPRAMGYYFDAAGTLIGAQQLDPYLVRRQKEKSVDVEDGSLKAQFALKRSKDYLNRLPDKIEEGCTAQYEWQERSYPSCNQVFEFDMSEPYITGSDGMAYENFRIVNNGYWRDVSMVREWDGHKMAVKTMRYEHEFEARNYDRHRKDALASDRLTSSPYVANIYGYCGNSGVFDYANDGDIDMLIWADDSDDQPKLTKFQKLDLALQMSRGIAAAHNVDREGQASFSHTDISPGQFILIDGIYKLNDFNRARLIMWNKEKDEPCPFYVGNNPGKFRSPEEYLYLGETEKIDVYSMGNIFFSLLTGAWPYEDIKTKEAQKLIKTNHRPPIPERQKESKHPLDIALLSAIDMCWAQDPSDRSTAREVEAYLEAEISKHRDRTDEGDVKPGVVEAKAGEEE